MKRFLIAIVSGALMGGMVLAQDATPPSGGATPQEQQSPAAAPSTQQAPEPSTAQPQTQQVPETQSAPQPAQQPSQAGQQAPQSSPRAPGSPMQAGGAPRIAPGSILPVQLTKSIDAKKAKTGDEVVVTVTQDMKNGNGEVIVPKDTKVVGHVTEAQARNKEQKESELGIAFDRAVMKTSEMQMPMSIQAIIAPPNANPGGGGSSGNEAAPSGGGGGLPQSAGRNGGAGGTAQPPTPRASASGTSGDAGTSANARLEITGNTQGVVGITDLKLSAAPSANQGSLLSSEKNNVKLESGTMMLLRVNQ